MFRRPCCYPLLLVALHAGFARAAEETTRLDEVVVTAPPMLDPLVVQTDPKAPRQPVPAQDGGDYLKNIPGFSVARKGGSSGDPVFRGMAGSRINLLMDGENLLGGCAGRMDPPTAYIFPETYDHITVLKGPQSVRYGGGNVAGTVLFERRTKRFEEAGGRAQGSAMFGSFGRNDQMLDLTAGNPLGYLRANATHSTADGFSDGGGRRIHSDFSRWSGGLLAGWTPDAHTRIELSLNRSDGQAAYADRSVDGVKFARSGSGLRIERADITPWLKKTEFQVYRNYVDHVMDNFTLRPVQSSNHYAYLLVSNPDRLTEGARLAFELAPGQNLKLNTGLDFQHNAHTLRSLAKAVPVNDTGAAGPDIDSKARLPDMRFDNIGLYGELSYALGLHDRLSGGLRSDWLSVDNQKSSGSGAGERVEQQTRGGFVRYERDLADLPVSLFAGLGQAQRAADWWERNRDFHLQPETSRQLDLGAIWAGERLHAALSVFGNHIQDYILVRNNGSARNIAARTHGFELDAAWLLNDNWRLTGTLAWVRGDNRSDRMPLAQTPPLEGRIGVSYADRRTTYGALLRLVAAQTRIHADYGTIVGQDFAPTPGFAVFSLNASYRPQKKMLLSAGIDNLFNRSYAEHINLAGAPIIGFDPLGRVMEPGRNLWIKLSHAID